MIRTGIRDQAKNLRTAMHCPDESEQRVKSMAERLMQEFDAQQKQISPLSQAQLRKVSAIQLHSDHNALMHKNRLKERRVEELKGALAQLVIMNGGVPESPLSSQHSKSQSTPVSPSSRIPHLESQIEEAEERIDNEARETERIEYMLERTSRAMQDTRNRCQALQRKAGILFGKYSEIQDLEAKSRYTLQHAKSEAQMFSQTFRKAEGKRSEKLGVLKKDKKEIEQSTARIVKTLAEQMVKGQDSKNRAETRAIELDAIYDKHITTLISTRRDQESQEHIRSALQSICTLVNRSEALSLDQPRSEVRLSDLLGFIHQYEMKMSSLESQVESLSVWKHELEMKCTGVRSQLAALRGGEYQNVDLMEKIRERMEALGMTRTAGTFNQLKTMMESEDFSVNCDDTIKLEAFVASSFMTLNIVIQHIATVLDYILATSGSLPGKLKELVHTLTLKHGDTYVTAGELQENPTWDQETTNASLFFREAFEDIPEWGLELDSIVRETCDMLLVRIFALDPRLKGDLRSWRSSQLSILDSSLHKLFLEKLISLAHEYLRGKLIETFSISQSLILTVADATSVAEKEVNARPLTDFQLRLLIDFKLQQASGAITKSATSTDNFVTDDVRKAFERKFRRLLSQQHAFRLEEESDEFVSKFHSKKKHEIMIEMPSMEENAEEMMEEDIYTLSQRKYAKSASRPQTYLSKSSSQGSRKAPIDTAPSSEREIEAFAQVRSLNARIRAVKDTDAPLTPTSQRLLPDIKRKGTAERLPRMASSRSGAGK